MIKLSFTLIKNGLLIIVLSIFGCTTIPEKTQNTPEYINKMDSLMTTSYERGLFNGNILIVKKDTIVYQKYFGFKDGTKQEKLTKKSIFNIGSIAKEFSAVSIMILVERGILFLDDPISKYNLDLPEWSNKITTRHLLNYSSGLPVIDYVNVKGEEDIKKDLKNLKSLLFKPGTDFNYNNNSVYLQERIIESITNKSYKDFVKEEIIIPLKMDNSVFNPNYEFPNRTRCFDFDSNNVTESYANNGWLWTDINDLHKWINALNSNVIISKKSFQALLENHYIDGKAASIGEYLEQDQLQRHNGMSYKFESIFLNDFNNDILVILLSNYRNRVWDIGHQAYNIMLGKEFKILKKSVRQAIRNDCLEDIDKGIKSYYDLKQKIIIEYNFNDPNELNGLGYELLRLGNIQSAIKIFQLAISEFPNNANLYDSLGEVFYINKQYKLSLKNYEKSFELDYKNENAKNMIDKLKLKLR